MSRQLIDLTGQRFGRWTVIKRVGTYKNPDNYPDSSGSSPLWLCRCDCGTIRPVIGHSLRGGFSLSCGCTRREALSSAMKSYHAQKKIEEGISHVVL